MKLRTKFQDEDFELGEIVDADIATMPDGRIKLQGVAKNGGLHTIFYDKLEMIYSEWEDYEEPKAYYIGRGGTIEEFDPTKDVALTEMLKQIGNYFETEEATEKAAEKLKAIKRLEDKGFKITLHGCKGNAWLEANWGNLQGDYSDVLFLFGGEE